MIQVLLVLLAAILGIVIASITNIQIPVTYSRYTAVMLLAALDSIFGALKASLNGRYENSVFLSGLVTNSAVAGALTFLGDKLGVELYFAAIFAFGVRIFQNIAVIRRQLL
ncbi:MAG TPA: small basic family protein [Candidatus Dormibacteraeota bacterium]|nr:small basic family protein [Candidatus Dormibacteraeota bacterium]